MTVRKQTKKSAGAPGMERIVTKLDDYVGKVQELAVLTTQVLTKTEVQLEHMSSRLDGQQRELDAQSLRIDAMQTQFIDALEKFAERIAATNEKLMAKSVSETKALADRISKLEQWRMYVIGAAAVVVGLGTFVVSFFKDWIHSLIFGPH
jgi:hypothetical protein